MINFYQKRQTNRQALSGIINSFYHKQLFMNSRIKFYFADYQIFYFFQKTVAI